MSPPEDGGTAEAVALALLDLARASSRTGQPPAYLRRHLGEHLVEAGLDLDEALDHDLVPYLDVARTVDAARARSATIGHVLGLAAELAHRWDTGRPGQNAALMQTRLAVLGRPESRRTVGPWHVAWAEGLDDPSTVVGEAADDVTALATVGAERASRVVVAGDAAGSLTVWDADRFRRLATVEGAHDGAVLALDAGPADATVLSCGADGRLGVWRWVAADPPELRPVGVWRRGRVPLHGVVLLPGRSTSGIAVVAGEEALIHAIPLADLLGRVDEVSQEAVATVSTARAGAPVTALAAAGPDRLVTGDAAGVVCRWRLAEGARGAEIAADRGSVRRAHAGGVLVVAGMDDGSILSGGEDGTIAWTAGDGSARLPLVAETGPPVHALHVHSHRGATIVTATRGSRVYRWDLDGAPMPGAWPSSVSTSTLLAMATAVEDDGTVTAVTGARSDQVRRWRLPAGWGEGEAAARRVQVLALDTSDGDTTVLSGASDGSVVAQRPAAAARATRYLGHRAPITALATVLTADGTPLVVAAGFDGDVRAWTAADAAPWSAALASRAGTVRTMDAVTTLDGDPAVLLASWDGAVRLRRLADGEVLDAWAPAPTAKVWCASVVSGTTTAMLGLSDGLVLRWTPGAGDPEPVGRHPDPVVLVAAGRAVDGSEVMVSADEIGTLHAVGATTGAGAIGREPSGVDALELLAGREHGPVAVTTSPDGWLRVWDLRTGAVDPARLPLRRPTNALATSGPGTIAVATAGIVVAEYDPQASPARPV